ncbi:MAG: hypothetical protein LBI14_04715 [Treponema sp.]|nr:hypothetical protein [Treponema sp.]
MVHEDLPDRDIGEMLKAAGFTSFYSESETLVFYDDFGRPKTFFLDQIQGKFESFDPRNDGYAESLRSFYVHDESRYFFIHEESARPRQIEKLFGEVFASVPHTLDFLFSGRNIFIWFVFQSIALIVALIISRDKIHFIPIIPIILSFAWGALSGLIMSCVFIGLWELLYEPFGEIFSYRPFGGLRHRLKPYRASFFWAFLYTGLYGFLISMVRIPSIPAWTGFFCFILVEILAFAEAKKLKQKRKFFVPIKILPFVQKKRVFCASMAAFAFAVLLSAVLSPVFSGFFFRPNTNGDEYTANLPSALEYQKHMVYQSSFSFLPLSAEAREYNSYYLGEDGLIAGSANTGVINGWEIPPFPLEKLTEFLIDYKGRPESMAPPGLKDWISMAIIILACIPLGQRTGKRSGKIMKNSIARYARVAA